MIYFIQAEIVGRIKIGYTSKDTISSRVATLQTASPVKLRVLASRPGGKAKEQQLHVRFAHARTCGEWFDPVPELVRYIARVQARKWNRSKTGVGKNATNAIARQTRSEAYRVGAVVEHHEYGRGVITQESDPADTPRKITIQFVSCGPRHFLADVVRLKVIRNPPAPTKDGLLPLTCPED